MTQSSRKVLATGVVLLIFSIVLSGNLTDSFGGTSATRTVSMIEMGVAFDLPSQFTAFQWEDHEGEYKTGMRFGKKFRPGHFKYVPFELGFGRRHVDCAHSSKPSECVDAEYQRVKENVRNRIRGYRVNPEYITLFGNKAVRTTRDIPNRSIVIIGYLSPDQRPEPAKAWGEYTVRIEFTEDTSSSDSSKEYKRLIEIVVNSLRTLK